MDKKKSVLITTDGGFIENRFFEYNTNKYSINLFNIKDIEKLDCLNFDNIDCIIHLAGKTFEIGLKDIEEYEKINFIFTEKIAQTAIRNNINHFIYLSTSKVFDNSSGAPLNEFSPCLPTEPYSLSKLKAEAWLQSIQSNSFKVAIIRPPMEYGPNSYGNLYNLIKLASKNIPLPFGNTKNVRSIVFVDNLIELINTIIDQKVGGIFIAGDIEPISTEKLVSLIRFNLGMSKKLFSIPSIFKKIIKIISPQLYMRLYESFIVDNTNTNNKLNFVPPYSSEYGIEQMVKWFKQNN